MELLPEATPVVKPAPIRDGSPTIVIRIQPWGTRTLADLSDVFRNDPAHQGASSRAEVGQWPVNALHATDLVVTGQPAFQVACRAVPTVERSTWQERIRTVVLVKSGMAYVLIATCRDELWTDGIVSAFDEFFASVRVVEDSPVR